MEICEGSSNGHHHEFQGSSNFDNPEDRSNALSTCEGDGEICLSIRTSIQEVLQEIRNNRGSVIGDYTIPESFRLDTKWADVLKSLQVPYDPQKHILKGHGAKIHPEDTVESFYEMYSRRLPYYTVNLMLAGKDKKRRKRAQKSPNQTLQTRKVESVGVRRSKRQRTKVTDDGEIVPIRKLALKRTDNSGPLRKIKSDSKENAENLTLVNTCQTPKKRKLRSNPSTPEDKLLTMREDSEPVENDCLVKHSNFTPGNNSNESLSLPATVATLVAEEPGKNADLLDNCTSNPEINSNESLGLPVTTVALEEAGKKEDLMEEDDSMIPDFEPYFTPFDFLQMDDLYPPSDYSETDSESSSDESLILPDTAVSREKSVKNDDLQQHSDADSRKDSNESISPLTMEENVKNDDLQQQNDADSRKDSNESISPLTMEEDEKDDGLMQPSETNSTKDSNKPISPLAMEEDEKDDDILQQSNSCPRANSNESLILPETAVVPEKFTELDTLVQQSSSNHSNESPILPIDFMQQVDSNPGVNSNESLILPVTALILEEAGENGDLVQHIDSSPGINAHELLAFPVASLVLEEPLRNDSLELQSKLNPRKISNLLLPVTALVSEPDKNNDKASNLNQNKSEEKTLWTDTKRAEKSKHVQNEAYSKQLTLEAILKRINSRINSAAASNTNVAAASSDLQSKSSLESEKGDTKSVASLTSESKDLPFPQNLESSNATNADYSPIDGPEPVFFTQDTESYNIPLQIKIDSNSFYADNSIHFKSESQVEQDQDSPENVENQISTGDGSNSGSESHIIVPAVIPSQEATGSIKSAPVEVEALQSEDSGTSDCFVISHNGMDSEGTDGVSLRQSQDIVIKPFLMSFINSHCTNKDMVNVYNELQYLNQENEMHKLENIAPMSSVFLTTIFSSDNVLKQVEESGDSEPEPPSPPLPPPPPPPPVDPAPPVSPMSPIPSTSSSSSSSSSSSWAYISSMEVAEEIEITSTPLDTEPPVADNTSQSTQE